MTRRAAALLLALLAAGAARAGSPGDAGATFLKLSPGADAAALGDALVSRDGLAAEPSNPASAARARFVQAAFTHAAVSYGAGAPGASQEFAAVSYGAPAWGTAGLDYRGLLYGSTPGYDAFGNTAAAWDAADYAVGLFYAADRVPGLGPLVPAKAGSLAYGMAYRYVHERIADAAAAASAADLGLQYHAPWEGVRAGFAVVNLGSAIAPGALASPLPRVIRVGASYAWDRLWTAAKARAEYGLDTAADVVLPFDHGAQVGLGAEAAWRSQAFLRLGYLTGTDQGGAAGFGVGGGWRYAARSWAGQLDLGYNPASLLASQLRVTLKLVFAPGAHQ